MSIPFAWPQILDFFGTPLATQAYGWCAFRSSLLRQAVRRTGAEALWPHHVSFVFARLPVEGMYYPA